MAPTLQGQASVASDFIRKGSDTADETEETIRTDTSIPQERIESGVSPKLSTMDPLLNTEYTETA